MPWRRGRLPTPVFLGFPCGSAGKESPYNAGDLGSISGLGRSPGEGKGYPLQYSGLEKSMDCKVHGVAKSWTRLSHFHLHMASRVARERSFKLSLSFSTYSKEELFLYLLLSLLKHHCGNFCYSNFYNTFHQSFSYFFLCCFFNTQSILNSAHGDKSSCPFHTFTAEFEHKLAS